MRPFCPRLAGRKDMMVMDTGRVFCDVRITTQRYSSCGERADGKGCERASIIGHHAPSHAGVSRTGIEWAVLGKSPWGA